MILTELAYFGAGMAGGFFSSTPLGPINLWVADQTISSSPSSIRRFLAGIIAADVGFAAFAAFGYAAFLDDATDTAAIKLVAGLFLLTLGAVNLWRLRHRDEVVCERPPSTNRGRLSEFFLGAFMCGSNPGFLMFWIFALEVMDGDFGLPLNGLSALTFLAGIVFGDLLWFGLLIRLVHKGMSRLGAPFLQKIRVGIALTFVILGSAALLQVGYLG